MALTSEASAVWTGDLSGSGTVSLDTSHAARLETDWSTRVGDTHGHVGTPEELLAAAHASSYSMSLADLLARAGTPAAQIQVTAAVTFDPVSGITGSHLLVNATVADVGDDDYRRITEEAKDACPVSRALAGIPVTLESDLA